LKKYLQGQRKLNSMDGKDSTFKKFAISQIKVFILTGHDATSSSLCYVFDLQSINSPALERIRAENNLVFGTDLSNVQS